MKIVIACDSFKGCLSSQKAAEWIAKGIHSVCSCAEIVQVPVADGGEGMLEALGAAYPQSRLHTIPVRGPLGEEVAASYLEIPEGAVVEMAQASGLTLLPPEKRNPLETSTYGTGQLILHAVQNGAKNILLTLGGSATNDGGMGAAQALGVRFFDEKGTQLEGKGACLERAASCDLSQVPPAVREATYRLACDVKNPLCGRQGAAHVFAPQKGADPQMAGRLDRGLAKFADLLQPFAKMDLKQYPGAGAAGGLMLPFLAFWGAQTCSGIDMVLDLIRFDDLLDGTDLVLTGEGALDGQSVFGKVPCGVALRAKKRSVPVVAFTGRIGEGVENCYKTGLQSVFCIQNGPMALEESMARCGPLLKETAERVMRLFLLTRP